MAGRKAASSRRTAPAAVVLGPVGLGPSGLFVTLDALLGGALLTPVTGWLTGVSTPQRVMVPLVSASVRVYQRGTTTPVTLYANDAGTGSPVPQPVATDSDGHPRTSSGGPVYVAQPQKLDIAVSGTGLLARTIPVGIPDDARVSGAEQTANRGQPGGYPELDGSGLILGSRLPALAITDVHPVANDAAMLALPSPHEGMVAVRADLDNATFMHNGGTSGTDADWTQLSLGTGIDSVDSAGSLGASHTVDFRSVPHAHVALFGTLTADCVVTVANRAAGTQLLIIAKQDGTGGHALSVSDGTTSTPVTVASAANAVSAAGVACPDGSAVYVYPISSGAGGTVSAVDGGNASSF